MLENNRVIVGLSGGVDSTAAFILLRRQGFEPVGVHLVMIDRMNDLDRQRLKALEEKLGIEVHWIDCREQFSRSVEEPFLEAYRRCQTPNPCVICNEQLKVRLLAEEADRLGCYGICTGHYAHTVETPQGWSIARSRSAKDQSYMLYRLPREWIPRLIFPLGDRDKSETRKISAHVLGSSHFAQGDSQDICFLGGAKLSKYLKDRLPEETFCPGEMVCDGQLLGCHRGLPLYTEGQRKGLGLSGGPWFVAAKDPENNRLLLSHYQEQTCSEIFFEDARWQRDPETGRIYLVQHRYRSSPVPAQLESCDGLKGSVALEVPLSGVAPGQSLVFYDGDLLVGGGIICQNREV